MKILGMDTATAATTVALLDSESGQAVTRRDDPQEGRRPRHTTHLLALAVQTLQAAQLGWEDLDRIAVGVGPGTFTGLRIGIATALGLSRARGIPLVGVSTLHSLALAGASAARSGDDAVLAVIDARRGEVFAAGWALDDVQRPQAAPLLAPRALPVADLAGLLALEPRGWLGAGDGSVAFRQALERSGARIPKEDSQRNRVDALEHCRLAVGLAPEPFDGVRPQYLRLPDAEISLRAARPR